MAITRQEALAAAFEQSEAGTLEAPVERQIETDEAQTRPRDEHGRFTKAEQEAQAAQAADATAATQQTEQAAPAATLTEQAQTQVRKPPTSWKKDYWGHWEKLGSTPELSSLQDYIEQREADFAKGVSAYKTQWDQAQPLVQAMQPFLPELQQYGIQPQAWIQNLGNAHRTLALGSPDQKVAMFAQLATQYGIPLPEVYRSMAQPAQEGQQVQPQAAPGLDPQQFGYMAQTLNQLQNELQQFKHNQQQSQEQQLLQQINEFKGSVDPETFEAVRGTMGQLLDSGVATDLKTAYDKAIRLHDDIWQKQQTQEQAKQAEAQRKADAEREAQRQADLAKKKAAASSPRSASPTGATTAGGGKQDRRSFIAQQLDEATGRF